MRFLREAFGSNRYVTRVAIVAAIGGLLFGYDTGGISGALLFIEKDLHASKFDQQAIVGALLLGAVCGAAMSGWLGGSIARKRTIILAGLTYVVGGLGCALSPSVPVLEVFRFVLGLSVGTASFVAPMYIAELTPPSVRGGMTSL